MSVSSADIAAFRKFNRLHTQFAGVLSEHLLDSPLSLTEARLLYEIAQRDQVLASELVRDLGLDAGYVSRILRMLQKQGLVRRGQSKNDARQRPIILSDKGRALFATLNEASNRQAATALSRLPVQDRQSVIGAMDSITAVMEKRTAQQSPFTVRAHRVGDMGRIVHRQARLYHEEYGWTADYEALILEITAKFLRQFKPGREYCWVAECDGEIVGSVFVIEESADVARLRMLYVEPKMRGRGLGRHLVEQCISFARQTGYAKLVLWTNDILVSARTIYVACGFKLISEDAHFSFGKQLTGQTWELALAQETAD